MRRRAAYFPAMLLAALLCQGCASVEGLRPGTDSAGELTAAPAGVTMLYSQPPDQVFQAALAALPQVGLAIVETDPHQHYILAERGLNLTSNGENVGVYLTPVGTGTRVTVTSRRKTPTNILAKDWAMPVHLRLGALLGSQPEQRP